VSVYCASLVSAFACVLACLSAVSRLMFSMGRYAFIHASMGAANERHQTPHGAIGTASVLTAGVCIAVSGLPVLDGFGLTATFSSVGFLLAYLLICIAAPVDVYRSASLRVRHVAAGAIGVLLMLFTMAGGLFPVPDYPCDLLPWLFAALLLTRGLWYPVLAGRAPGSLAALRHDLE
jgi:amino acid transporter